MRQRETILHGLLFGLTAMAVCAAGGRWARADEPASATNDARAAIERGLPLVTKAAANYPTHRKCFSCHHQTLPMLAAIAGRAVGIDADVAAMLKTQAEHTHASFAKQHKALLEGNQGTGEGIGGKGLTVGYGLWTLRLADWPADEATAAMVTYLVKSQDDDGSWQLHATRPPMEESRAMAAAIALAGMRHYATAEQEDDAAATAAKAKTFLLAAKPESQEDRVGRLWGLFQLNDGEAPGTLAEAVAAARQTVLAAQRDDGGWAQADGMTSDAYATGQTLFVLRATGTDLAADAVKRGCEFLLKTQQPDGSWLVETRSKPVQIYFDNGDPHGKNQFISTPASCWALAALARGLPASGK